MKKLHYTFILVILAAIGVFLPVEAHADNKYGIVIDGAFEDWKSLPITEFSFSYENGQNIKYVSLVTDESNMYFYLNMAPEGHNYNNLQPSGHKLTIGNKVFWMTFSDLFPSEDLSKVGQTKDLQQQQPWRTGDKRHWRQYRTVDSCRDRNFDRGLLRLAL